MIEDKEGPQLTQLQLNSIMDSLLKIPRKHKLIHPCQERNKYTAILDWLTNGISLLRNKDSLKEEENRLRADKQQELILSSLGQMIEMTRKECQQKGVILEIIQEYFINTLNAYWTLFRDANKEATYQYERNALSIEQQYLKQLTELQNENQQFKKDRDHRWRNMFMLIKDNRVHRKQNKKLLKSVSQEMEKNKSLAEQILKLEIQNQKLKLKISSFEGQDRVEDYIAACADLVELQEKIRKYPKKSKKVLKNELLKIEIGQTKNLQDKIQFIIKAIQETEEIVDEIYEESPVWSNFSFNISTQTDLKTEEKGTNTPVIKTESVQVVANPKDLLRLDFIDTVLVKIFPQKKEKKDTYRQSRTVMFATTMNLGKLAYKKDNENKSKHISKKEIKQCSLCESVKITIFQGRIAYISSYNSQIFNGLPTGTSYQVQKKSQQEFKTKVIHYNDISCQTEGNYYEDSYIPTFSFPTKTSFKPNTFSKSLLDIEQNHNLRRKQEKPLEIYDQCSFFFDPDRTKHKSKVKHSFKSDKSCDSLRSSVMLKKLNKDSIKEIQINEKRESKSEFRFAMKKMTKNDKQIIRRQIEEQISKENEDKSESKGSSEENIVEQLSQQTTRDAVLKSKENSSPLYSKTTKPSSEDISQIMTPQYLQSKPFSNNLNTLNSLKKQNPQIKRNQSSFLPQHHFKKIQSNRLSKLNLPKGGLPKHKRTTTQFNQEIVSPHMTPFLEGQSRLPSKMKPLHRISEDISEMGEDKIKNMLQKNKEKSTNLLPFKIDKEGEFELKGNDFNRGVQKILKTMDLRYNELMNSSYTFKTYLSSHFKVLYGRELYQNFLNFLIHYSSTLDEIDETIVCLSILCNPKLPERYSIDIFKTFAITVHKFLSVNESPLQGRVRSDILRYMTSQYLNEEQGKAFEVRMLKNSVFSFFGWYNCLQMQVRKGTIQSQLFSFCFDILLEPEEIISLNLMEDITFFLSGQSETFKHKIKLKYQFGQKIPLHRLCLFCFTNQWKSFLNIETTLLKEYDNKLGVFNETKSLNYVLKYYQVLSQFKDLQKCFKYRLSLHKKYFCGINRYLLMLAELTIVEFQLKTALPLSLDLRYLNLTFEGLQKKRYHEQMKTKMESLDRNHRNTTIT